MLREELRLLGVRAVSRVDHERHPVAPGGRVHPVERRGVRRGDVRAHRLAAAYLFRAILLAGNEPWRPAHNAKVAGSNPARYCKESPLRRAFLLVEAALADVGQLVAQGSSR
jgi:hypothetical protein